MHACNKNSGLVHCEKRSALAYISFCGVSFFNYVHGIKTCFEIVYLYAVSTSFLRPVRCVVVPQRLVQGPDETVSAHTSGQARVVGDAVHDWKQDHGLPSGVIHKLPCNVVGWKTCVVNLSTGGKHLDVVAVQIQMHAVLETPSGQSRPAVTGLLKRIALAYTDITKLLHIQTETDEPAVPVAGGAMLGIKRTHTGGEPPFKMPFLSIDYEEISPDILRMRKLKEYVARRANSLPEACGDMGYLNALDSIGYELMTGKDYLNTLKEFDKTEWGLIEQKLKNLRRDWDIVVAQHRAAVVKQPVVCATDTLNIHKGHVHVLLEEMESYYRNPEGEEHAWQYYRRMWGLMQDHIEIIMKHMSCEVGSYLFSGFC